MELITLLIRIPTIVTLSMAALNFFVIFSNKISLEKFLKIRKVLAIIRWVLNLIAVIVISYFKLYEIAILIAGLMLYCAIEDVIIFYVFKKIISEKGG